MSQGKTFSESWYRVCSLKLSLRPTVVVTKQRFRGETWYMAHDPFNNSFFRMRPEAHDFVSRLRPDRTVEEAWKESLERRPDSAPGQEDVIRLLTQLHHSGLLYHANPADSDRIFERYEKRRQRELRSWLQSLLFVQIPLFDPEPVLKRLRPMVLLLTGPLALLAWFLVVANGVRVVLGNFELAIQQAEGILSPDNLIYLYVALVCVKVLHELGHAMVCSRYGGEIHTMGVMLLVFTPLPYVDATSAWSLRSRWQRAYVGAAGMLVELFIAGLAAAVWARTGPGALHSVAHNVMVLCSISTLVFNLNPLLRYDGYYILADALDYPNLQAHAQLQWKHLIERYLFGLRESAGPARTRGEAIGLALFGLGSWIYRLTVFGGIILFVADKFLILGLLMALACVFTWIVLPIHAFVHYLFSPQLARQRGRVLGVTAGSVVLAILMLAILPAPRRFRAPGVLQAERFMQVVTDSPGRVKAVLARSGTRVEEKTPLLELENPELLSEQKMVRAQLEEIAAMEQRARSDSAADLDPLRRRREAIGGRLAEIDAQVEGLTVRARQEGTWVAPRIQDAVGTWLLRGRAVGLVIDDGSFEFAAVVSQEEAASLFSDPIHRIEVRLHGQGNQDVAVKGYQVIPFQHDKLPSPALGWRGGGEVAVSAQDESGVKTAEPFFKIDVKLAPPGAARFFHGRSGVLRFTLKSEPLIWQWARRLSQLLQRRYRI